MKSVFIFFLLFLSGFCGFAFGFPAEIPLSFPPADSSNLKESKTQDTVLQYNTAGSYGLFLNGIRTNLQYNNYNVSANNSYRNYNG